METDRGHGEEVDGDQLLGMILQKGAPGLRRRFAAAHHVFADAALPDVDAELQDLTSYLVATVSAPYKGIPPAN